jgi:hypothetical protein
MRRLVGHLYVAEHGLFRSFFASVLAGLFMLASLRSIDVLE